MSNKTVRKNKHKIKRAGKKTNINEMGYTVDILTIYSTMATHNTGNIKAIELLEKIALDKSPSEHIENQCMSALWRLYKDGFINVKCLSEKGCVIALWLLYTHNYIEFDTVTEENFQIS